MDDTTLAAMANDTKYREDKITKVVSSADRLEGWTIQVEDGGYLYIPRHREGVIAPAVGEIVRTYSRGPGHPVRGIAVGGRVYTYMTQAQEDALTGRTDAPVTPKPRDLLVELNTLRRACRALARVEPDADVFDEIKPEDMRRVLVNRGWTLTGTQPWPGDPNRVAFETYDHPTATGADSFGIVNFVKVPMDATAADWRSRVYEWVMAVALRHGDVSPAEILAETL